jgi:hypothetical protein
VMARSELSSLGGRTLLKALVALVPACTLLAGSTIWFVRAKTLGSLFQLAGAACLSIVVLTHICEAAAVFPWMGWGLEDSIGHYVDLSSAVLGLTLFPLGYLLQALTTRGA